MESNFCCVDLTSELKTTQNFISRPDHLEVVFSLTFLISFVFVYLFVVITFFQRNHLLTLFLHRRMAAFTFGFTVLLVLRFNGWKDTALGAAWTCSNLIDDAYGKYG